MPARSGRWTAVDAVVALFALGLLAITVDRAGHIREYSTAGLLVYVIVPGLAALVLLASLRAGTLLKAKILLGLVTGGIAILLCSLFLEFQTARSDRELKTHPSRYRSRAFARLGLPFDAREIRDVVADLNRQGTNAVPFLAPSSFRDVKGLAVVPLAGISSALTVYCNENGRYITFQSDEHGFRNPAGSHSHPADVVILGDSFGMGYCVEEPDSIAGTIRASLPATVNLSASGNGPLFELAALREFGARLKPRFVVWLYFDGNDLGNLENEARSPVLRRYLDPAFQQHLLERQAEVDLQLAGAAARAPSAPATSLSRQVFSDFLRLKAVRGLLAPWLTAPRANPWIPTLEKVLIEARNEISGWDGKLVFVFLPELQAVRNPGDAYSKFRREEIGSLVHRLGIPFVDMVERFSQSPVPPQDPRFPLDSHYNADGYRLTGRAVLEQLR